MAKRIIFPQKSVVAVERFELAPPASHEVAVRTLYSLMSIGTEMTILHARYEADSHFAARFSFPQRKTGVQAVGEVIAAGAAVTEFQPGDRVFMRMAHTSHWTLDARLCSTVPAILDPKLACWCGLAKTAFRAAHAAPFELGGDVLVIGAGPVGQMAIRWAKSAGMAAITAIDVHPLRLALAARGGATRCFEGTIAAARDALFAQGGDAGFELVVDTTGDATVFPEALRIARQFGKVVLLGDTGYPSRQRLTSEVMTKGLTIVATHDHHDRGGWTQRRIDSLFFRLAASGSFPLEGLITHEFRPDDCEAAYALASNARGSTLGILFDWTRDATEA
jgi:2-desacetyl-2-hydroxyethyl bacteriochlorophyllide A dehydrogenase